MKKILKNDIYIFITLLFIVLLFKNNILFKKCILNGCVIFFEQVFPTLFPMMIINDILINYNFIFYLNKIFHKPFKKIFHMSNAAMYIFLMSLLSGTPTNGYIAGNLVKEQNLNPKDASIILSYSFFLNPLFLMTMLNTIFKNQATTIKIILIYYSINLIIAFFFRKYPYHDIILNNNNPKNFSIVLSTSITHAFSVLINILGTIIFYFVLCEGINIFVKNPSLNCFINGILEVTGGLAKLNTLHINYKLKELLAIAFLSFGGFSIHSQIKNILNDTNISYKYFFRARLFHLLFATGATIITS